MILPIALQFMPNHQMLFTASDGCWFFFDLSILDLGHFSQVILPIVLQIMPQLSGAVHSIWWLGFSFYLFSQDWGHFSQMILPIVLQFMPNHQVLFTASDGWGYFFWTCSPILDLGHFSQVILQLYYKLCPSPKITPTIRCCEQHLMVGVNFFFDLYSHSDLFSHSGLRAFFTNDFANCTTNYAPTIRCCSQHLMVGFNFFLTCSPILDLGHFSQVILPIVLQIMPQPKNNPNHQVLWTASDGWG